MHGVHRGEAVGGLECPDLSRVQEDQLFSLSSDDARWALQGRRGASQREPLEATLHPLLREWLEQVVDNAQLEGLHRVLAIGGGEHEHRRRRRLGHGAYEREPRLFAAAHEAHVHESDVDPQLTGRVAQDLACFVDGRYGADHLREV